MLLLDEPFGALDARVRKDLRRSGCGTSTDATGQTTIFVTHDQDEALELADRVAIINEGRLEQVGTPEAIYDDPASAFVMTFVGDSACIPVRVEGGRARLGRRSLPVRTGAVADGPANLFVRPHDLVPVVGEAGDLSGVVRAVRWTAPDHRVEIALEGASVEILTRSADRPLAIGDTVALRLVGGRVFPPS